MEIEQIQFDSIVDYDLARKAAVMMLGAWYCFLPRTDEKVHYVGLRTTNIVYGSRNKLLKSLEKLNQQEEFE